METAIAGLQAGREATYPLDPAHLSVSGLELTLQSLLLYAYLLSRSQNPSSSSFLSPDCEPTLSHVSVHQASPPPRWVPFWSPILPAREGRQRKAQHLARGYAAGKSGLTPRLSSTRREPQLFPAELPRLGPLPWTSSWTVGVASKPDASEGFCL